MKQLIPIGLSWLVLIWKWKITKDGVKITHVVDLDEKQLDIDDDPLTLAFNDAF